jgi:squalene-hopene/tetraprenyl-beta-curcumene cyclase
LKTPSLIYQQPTTRLNSPRAALKLDFEEELEEAITRAWRALLSLQRQEGYWSFELEADCTIPAEYILMMHFISEIDENLEARIAVYLRARQCGHGGWNLYCDGDFDLSCTVKVYYALKLVGDSPDAEHMVKAREAILAHGGAARVNVFTRISLALFGQIPWRAVPFIPVEIMLLPRWFPFHILKVSYWSRTVMVPLFILCSLKPRAKNPRGVNIRELFTTPPELEKRYFHPHSRLNRAFLTMDRVGRRLEPFIPPRVRRRAIECAERWFIERLNGTDGLGGIFPAMVNALEALACLGYGPDHPSRVAATQALEKLLVVRGESAYCQPCLSPVWDTCLCSMTLLEAAGGSPTSEVLRALDWLTKQQVLDEPGDWRLSRPELKGGGWAFQFANPHYPDLDDTAVVAWAMLGLMAAGEVNSPEVRRGAEYLLATQQSNGFWEDKAFTAPGFPRVFYLKYHGYDKYFPLWALARYRNLLNKRAV